jgi:hypothetical protein
MRLIVAFFVAVIVLASWDILAHNGKYGRAVSSMAGKISAAYHPR